MSMSAQSPAVGVSLKNLLPRARFFGADDIHVTSCSNHSLSCQPGDLFVAMLGAEHDGHDHIAAAITQGARAILAEQWIPSGDIPFCIVEDSREALGHVCHALAGHPAERVPVIGVTGTNGKTTTSCLIASILHEAGQLPAVAGTLGYCDGRRTMPAPLTTPPAPLLADWLARSEARGATHAVLEVSSHALAQRRTAGFEIDVACVTNVRRDHLDFHGTLANYKAAKARLFSQLREGGVAVLNLDDAACREFLPTLQGPVLTYGMNSDAEVTATVIERHRSEQTFLLTIGSDTVPVRTAIIGDHHVSNCLAAATVGLVYGIDISTIVRGIERITTMPGRLERIECGQPFSAFVDYAHTPDALEQVLGTLRQVCTGRLICVFGAGGDRDRAKRPLMGRAVEKAADLAIVTDDNPRREKPTTIASQILRGFKRPGSVVVIHDRTTAIQTALAAAEPGDCVLVAGKGHESVQIVGTRRYEFDDRDVVRQWLYATDADWATMPVLRRAA
ncbi:MAG: UDP-N-acetylmuramoyl-L-alanyl-D-glutamate--2,6-diaminopimelate ligase [Planctomycetes bacterium]|nr:UDP-N-acetylmuramoyl-L-alanyl-D-glutamate--2,6-diaminopimelate ligase [Planctomycetota bacterium]